MPPSFAEPAVRRRIVARLRSLEPDAQRRWGRMSAPEMVAHLTDQMTHTLGYVPTHLRRNVLRLPLMKTLAIYWVRWPKGRIHGPPEAYVTRPASWSDDLKRLIGLVEEFGARQSEGEWPHHALFGSMTGRDWGVFCHKHFDHHLRQFGA